MENNILRFGLVAILILIPPFIYVEILTFTTTNLVFNLIHVFSAKTKISLASIITFVHIISAIITVLITALPGAYLAKKHIKIIATLFIVSIECFPVATFFAVPPFKAFNLSLLLGQFIAVVLSVFISSWMGSRLAAKKQDNAAV
jgi:hypothetical protein